MEKQPTSKDIGDAFKTILSRLRKEYPSSLSYEEIQSICNLKNDIEKDNNEV